MITQTSTYYRAAYVLREVTVAAIRSNKVLELLVARVAVLIIE